ncbi:MAG: hypothetical protein CBC02_000970 [Flavobacteriaceae bacterium TMED42]|jgi:hypothetical protein|nr:hypothetical protein [Flavobacteriaceae bacterium]MDC3238431.1 hypothetical protein [Flavobacteriaceae bacterium]RPG63702.1 MAG: hypothetical protein CBC02_010130 [Flavobacteriaceae bacterium TMED42]RPG67956.1 MAG: hypothetical protein CBC02_000970 [Flavobacteriaceae bacterium TMED42]|tara:strand:- start:2495 stop:2920 length:426 start_codon:yes stop_codon:yes gene_type:complete
MNELDILNHFQLSFVANAVYMLTFTGLVFITFRLVRFQREQNSNILGKILVSVFGLCTTFYGYSVFSYLRNAQLAQSYRLSELKESGVELSTVTNSFIEFTGYSVADGWPPAFMPETAANIFLITFALMIIAGTWMKLSKD